jgi:hypothetical protein
MTEPEPIKKLKLVVLVCAAILLLNIASGRTWVAAMETASFRLSLSLTGDTVRFRTGSSDTGRSGFKFVFERRR